MPMLRPLIHMVQQLHISFEACSGRWAKGIEGLEVKVSGPALAPQFSTTGSAM